MTSKAQRFDQLHVEQLKLLQTSGTDYIPLADGSGGLTLMDGRYLHNLYGPGGRLSLSSSDPVAESTGAGTVYYLPYLHNFLTVYDSINKHRWVTGVFSPSNIAWPLSGLTSGKNYDLFIHLVNPPMNGDVLELESDYLPWTNDSTRASAVVRDSTTGLYCQSGHIENLYVGTVRINSNQTKDTDLYRHVWNTYNRIERRLLSQGYSTWSPSTSFGAWTNTTAVEIVQGLALEPADIFLSTSASCGAAKGISLGIGYDSNSSNSADIWNQLYDVSWGVINAQKRHTPAAGFHTYYPLGKGDSGTTFWLSNGVHANGGLLGKIMA